jgi:hypothetical protein
MSDDSMELPEGWTEADMRAYLTKHSQSGTYAGDDQVDTVDVSEITETGAEA